MHLWRTNGEDGDLSALRGHEWVGEIGKALTEVKVRVRQPDVTHPVRIKDFETWMNRQDRTPAEIVLKSRLRQMRNAAQLATEVEVP